MNEGPNRDAPAPVRQDTPPRGLAERAVVASGSLLHREQRVSDSARRGADSDGPGTAGPRLAAGADLHAGQRGGRRPRLSDRLRGVRPARPPGDRFLRLRPEVRRVPGPLRPVGPVGDPNQGDDADPLQDRHDRLGRGAFQFRRVHGGESGHARRPVLPGRRPAEGVRSADSRLHRTAADAGDVGRGGGGGRRVPGASAAVERKTEDGPLPGQPLSVFRLLSSVFRLTLDSDSSRN